MSTKQRKTPRNKSRAARTPNTSASASAVDLALSVPAPKPAGPVQERELVPYFAAGDPEGAKNLCELPAPTTKKHFKKASKPRRSTTPPSSPHKASSRPVSASPAAPASSSSSSSSPRRSPKPASSASSSSPPRAQYAAPEFVNSPSPDSLPHPSFLLASPSASPPASPGRENVARVLNFDADAPSKPAPVPASSPSGDQLVKMFATALHTGSRMVAYPPMPVVPPHADPSTHLKLLLGIQAS